MNEMELQRLNDRNGACSGRSLVAGYPDACLLLEDRNRPEMDIHSDYGKVLDAAEAEITIWQRKTPPKRGEQKGSVPCIIESCWREEEYRSAYN